MKINQALSFGALATTALLGLGGRSVAQHGDGTSLDEAIQMALGESSREFIRQVGTPFAGVESAWQAANRDRDLRTYLLPGGACVLPRSNEDDGWRWGLTLERFGRVGRTHAADTAVLRVDGERAEYVRGSLVEWYVNRERGVEHGFDVLSRPAGDGELELSFETRGELGLRIEPGARDVVFTGADGRDAVSYADLRAFDASGRELDARFVERGGALALLVDDTAADYPVTIDPLINNLQAILSPDGAPPEARFGTSVSIDGNRAVVGATNDAHVGQAYALAKIGSSWEVDTKFLIGPGGQKGDRFGASVCILGDNIVVGAPMRNVHGVDSGGVYYYRRISSGDWVLVEFLTSATTAANDQFGSSVDMGVDFGGANTYLIVGAPGRTVDGNLFAGAAYVFFLQSEWTPVKLLTDPNGGIADFYGSSVSIDGDIAAVGAPFADGSFFDMGRVHVWKRSQLTFVEDQFIDSPTADHGGNFGEAISVDSNRLLVGAPGEDSAHVFLRGLTSWQHDETFTGEAGGSFDFGRAVALDTTGFIHSAIIGAPATQAAYIYAGSLGTWSQTAKLEQQSAASGDAFGASVAIQGAGAVVGAPGRDVNAPDTGAVFAYELVGSSWVPTQTVIGRNWDAGEGLGFSAAIDGDTAVVGAVGDSDLIHRSGAAYVFQRTGTDWSMQAKLTAGSHAQAGARFGESVGISGTDVVVGAPKEPVVIDAEGAAYVFNRSGSEWSLAKRLVAVDSNLEDLFGFSVAIDSGRLVIGSPEDDDLDLNAGAAYAYERSGGDWIFVQKLISVDGGPRRSFGQAVDLDGDTIIIGSPDQYTNGIQSGTAYLFEHSGIQWEHSVTLAPSPPADFIKFGDAVAIQGDRAVVGAPSEDGTAPVGGVVHVFERQGASWSVAAKLTGSDASSGANLGASVSLDKALIAAGAKSDSNVAVGAGAVYVYHETPGGWVELGKLEDATLGSQASLGFSVGISGTTLVAGAPGGDEIAPGSGKAYAVLVPPLEPTTYCTAKSNSCGSLPAIVAEGESSASRSSGFEVRASNAKAGKFGVLLYSTGGRAAVPFQGGLLCVAPGSIRRTVSVQDTSGTPGQCDGVLAIDMNAFAAGSLGGNPIPELSEPGTQVNGQFWGRDVPGRSLLSDAIEYVVGN